MKKVLFFFGVIGLAVAGAKSYTVRLYDSATIGGKELPAGEYKLEVMDQKAVLRKGKIDAEAPVRIENGSQKFGATTVRLAAGRRIQEIRVGGTTMKVVFTEATE
jgi:hypothetical protein